MFEIPFSACTLASRGPIETNARAAKQQRTGRAHTTRWSARARAPVTFGLQASFASRETEKTANRRSLQTLLHQPPPGGRLGTDVVGGGEPGPNRGDRRSRADVHLGDRLSGLDRVAHLLEQGEPHRRVD